MSSKDLQTDGYEVYDRLCEGAPKVIHAGCWSHARRKFFEAQKSSKKAGSAEVALSSIGKLYVAEGQRKRYQDPAAFAAERRRLVEPVLKDFHAWLQRRASQVPPETLLGKAVNYALVQWPKLLRYLEHPAMTPDTNACENAIRPFTGVLPHHHRLIRSGGVQRMLTLAAVEPRRSTAGTR